MAKLVSLSRGLSHGSITHFEPTKGRCRGMRPPHMAAIGDPRGCRFVAKTSLEMAKLVSLSIGLSHGSIACFGPSMGRCRGTRPLHMAAIADPRGCRFVAKIAKTNLEMAKLVTLRRGSDGLIVRFERLWGVVGERAP